MAKYKSDDNLSMFDMLEPEEALSPKLDVVKLSYISAEAMTWQELFKGFNELHAITFSSGINFMYALLEMFEKVEIVFGNEMVMSNSLQDIMAYQSNLIERIRNEAGDRKQKLLDRIDNETVRLYVARQQLSHEKIYLLKSADGRKRVIMGSANMSYNAFSGKQRENISCIDDEGAYDWYMHCFEELKEASTDEITHKAIVIADPFENIDELPVSKSVKVRKTLIVEPSTAAKEEVQFMLDTHKLSKELAPTIPKGETRTGRIVIVPDMITRIRRARSDEVVKERELRSEYPQLNVDVNERKVTLNGEKLDLSPSSSEVANDVAMQVVGLSAVYISKNHIPAEVLERETSVQTEIAKNDPKLANMPADRMANVIAGKVNKVLSESCLYSQALIKDPTLTVEKYVAKNGGTVTTMLRYTVGEGMQKREENFAEEVAKQMK